MKNKLLKFIYFIFVLIYVDVFNFFFLKHTLYMFFFFLGCFSLILLSDRCSFSFKNKKRILVSVYVVIFIKICFHARHSGHRIMALEAEVRSSWLSLLRFSRMSATPETTKGYDICRSPLV